MSNLICILFGHDYYFPDLKDEDKTDETVAQCSRDFCGSTIKQDEFGQLWIWSNRVQTQLEKKYNLGDLRKIEYRI